MKNYICALYTPEIYVSYTCMHACILCVMYMYAMHAFMYMMDSPLHVHCFCFARSVMTRAVVMAIIMNRLRSRNTMIAIKLPTIATSVEDDGELTK